MYPGTVLCSISARRKKQLSQPTFFSGWIVRSEKNTNYQNNVAQKVNSARRKKMLPEKMASRWIVRVEKCNHKQLWEGEHCETQKKKLPQKMISQQCKRGTIIMHLRFFLHPDQCSHQQYYQDECTGHIPPGDTPTGKDAFMPKSSGHFTTTFKMSVSYTHLRAHET